jgi:Tol biopolymer transport system component
MSSVRQATSLAVAFVLLALAASTAHAQSFGQNKVQYDQLRWSVLETPHVRFHFYAQEESLSRSLAAFSESVCVEYDRRFRVVPRHPIPILLYSAHQMFQQTNATPGLISESVGGLTELVKGRVLIPHNGSWGRLTWVARHELAHAYMLEKLSRVMKEHKRSHGYLPPLWFIEGLAEYCGTKWDADAEGLLRDAVLTDKAQPLTRSDEITGTVLMYKEGQSFLLYCAERFGPDKVFDLMDNWYRADDFEAVFKLTYGVRLSEADKDWFGGLKKRFYPTVALSHTAAEQGERLTRDGHYNLGTRVVPPAAGSADSSLRFCYFEAREGSIELVMNEPDGRGHRRTHRLLRSGTSPSFESFHLFQSRPDASPGGHIVLSAKHGGRDALYVIDAKQHRLIRKMEFSNLVSLQDPTFMPGDTSVVFSAQDYSGRSDLWRASWSNKRPRYSTDQKMTLERLTNDDCDDLEPDVSPDGKYVVFASDRPTPGNRYSICRMSLQTGAIEIISRPPAGDDHQPVYSPDGKWIAFRSTRGGTSDLYVRSAEPSREYRRVTHMQGPVTDPDWLSNNKGLIYTGQERVEFQSYRMKFDPDTLKVEEEAPPPTQLASLATGEDVPQPITPKRPFDAGAKVPYERRLGLDLVQNAIAVDPALGGSGGGQIALSDVLGNEQYYIYLANDSERFGGSFWDGWEGGLTYINQSRRLNYGLGLFRMTEVYDPDLDLVRREPRLGVLGLATYPFNRFNRIEGSLLVRHADDHRLRNGDYTNVDLVSQYLSFVHDNSGWTALGPSSGSRWMLSAGFTRDMTSGAGDFASLLADYRMYQHPISLVVSATRLEAQSSMGNDAQLSYLGGRTSLRGFDYRTLSGLQTVLLQQEFRVPLVRGLTFALPTMWQFPPISAAVFADAGFAWDHGFEQHLGSAGTGVYMGGGYFPVIRWNFVWTTTDFQNFTTHPRTQFMIGYNF